MLKEKGEERLRKIKAIKQIDKNQQYIEEVMSKISEKEGHKNQRLHLINMIMEKGLHLTRQKVMLNLVVLIQVSELLVGKVRVSD